MKEIRMGNDITLTWTITNPGSIDLSNAVVKMFDQVGRRVDFLYTIANNIVSGTYYGKDQKAKGTYRLELVLNDGKEDMVTLDKVNCFTLVGVCDFGIVRGEDENGVTTVAVELESTLNLSYIKPAGGIPYSDLEASVQDSLDRADTALQEHQSLTGYATETWVENKNYLTEHQDISGKANTSDLANVAFSGSYNDLGNTPTIPTLVQPNWNESDTTSYAYIQNKPTNVSAFTNDAGYLKHQDITGKEDRVQVVSISPESGAATINPAEVGKYYNVSGTITSLTITLPSVSDTTHLSSFVVSFTVGASSFTPTVTPPTGVTVSYYSGFQIVEDTEYELNFMFNGTKWIVAYATID